MGIRAKFTHVNVIAVDGPKLIRFYQDVLGCVPIPPERDHHGPPFEAATGIAGARARGLHLRLPGCGKPGPAIEILQYDQSKDPLPAAINRPGFAHIAFEVEDIRSARQAVLEAGGGEFGQIASLQIPGAGTVEIIYLTDPESNIIELQHWSS